MIDPATTRKRADRVVVGDRLDLEGDRYADPGRDEPSLRFEFQTVTMIEVEPPNTIAIGFESIGVVGFPPDHLIPWLDGPEDAP